MGRPYPSGLPVVDEVVGKVQNIWDRTPVHNRRFFGPTLLVGKQVQVFQTDAISKEELKYSWWHREVHLLRAALCDVKTPMQIKHVMTHKLSYTQDE